MKISGGRIGIPGGVRAAAGPPSGAALIFDAADADTSDWPAASGTHAPANFSKQGGGSLSIVTDDGIGSEPAVQTDGTAYMQTDAAVDFSGTSQLEIFFIAKCPSPVDATEHFLLKDGTTGAGSGRWHTRINSKVTDVLHEGDTGISRRSGGTNQGDKWRVWNARHDFTASADEAELYIDDIPVHTSVEDSDNASGDTFTDSILELFSDHGSNNATSGTAFAYIAIYERILTADERAQMLAFLEYRFGAVITPPAGYKAWVRPNADYVTLSGSDVSAITDSTGTYTWSQGVAARQPPWGADSLGGWPGIGPFDDTQPQLLARAHDGAFNLGASGNTLVSVFAHPGGTPAEAKLVFAKWQTSGERQYLMFGYHPMADGSVRWTIRNSGDTAVQSVDAVTPVDDTEIHCQIATFDGSGEQSVSVDADAAAVDTGITYNAEDPVTAFGGFGNGITTNAFDGTLGEFLFYEREWTEDDRERWRQYYNWKYDKELAP